MKKFLRTIVNTTFKAAVIGVTIFGMFDVMDMIERHFFRDKTDYVQNFPVINVQPAQGKGWIISSKEEGDICDLCFFKKISITPNGRGGWLVVPIKEESNP